MRKNSSKEQINEILDEVMNKDKTYTYRTQDHKRNDAWYQTSITPILNKESRLSNQAAKTDCFPSSLMT